eukprot:4438131-Lingulodinium_polyedra.AAC.1
MISAALMGPPRRRRRRQCLERWLIRAYLFQTQVVKSRTIALPLRTQSASTGFLEGRVAWSPQHTPLA